MYPFCLHHRTSVPESGMERVQLVYSWRRYWGLSPRSLVCSLLVIWSALYADAIFLSMWALKLSFQSKNTPSRQMA